MNRGVREDQFVSAGEGTHERILSERENTPFPSQA